MAGQKRATKLEYLKILEKYDDNDILLIDTRKDPWIKKVGSVTPLNSTNYEFTNEEKEALKYAYTKAKSEGKNFVNLSNMRDIVHMFIGSRFNYQLCKSMPIADANKQLMELYDKYIKSI